MTATTTDSPLVHSTAGGQDAEANGQPRASAREGSGTIAAGLAQLRRVTGAGFLRQTPASIADVAAYTKAGGWMPGNQARWLETCGKLYGYLVAVPATAGLFLVVWFVQRPTRLGFAVALVLAGRWAL